MAYDERDIRKWITRCTEDVMHEVFSPMTSLASYEEPIVREARSETLETLTEAFVGYMQNTGVNIDTVPFEFIDAVRAVIEEAYERGRESALDEQV